jgi:large subunit ribosomal protein L29
MFAKNLRKKTPKELLKIIDELKAELFLLRFKNSTGQLDHPHKINLVKKDIARTFTVINEKEEMKIKKNKNNKIEKKLQKELKEDK